jgi:hypothetical protein
MDKSKVPPHLRCILLVVNNSPECLETQAFFEAEEVPFDRMNVTGYVVNHRIPALLYGGECLKGVEEIKRWIPVIKANIKYRQSHGTYMPVLDAAEITGVDCQQIMENIINGSLTTEKNPSNDEILVNLDRVYEVLVYGGGDVDEN